MDQSLDQKLKSKLKGLKENEALAPFTTFKIGGPARYFFPAQTSQEITQAVELASSLSLPFFILGGGSNLLISDQGFTGLVIKVSNTNLEIKDKILIVGAGLGLGEAVKRSVGAGLTGLEWEAGIPGTIGGAIRGNAGAFGHSISELVVEVEAVDQKGKVFKLNQADCQFSYRESIFKKNRNVILAAGLKLKAGDRKKSQAQVADILKQRSGKHPLEFPSAGSIFKNVEIKNLTPEELARLKPKEEFISRGKIPAAWLIEELDLKGKKIGGALVSPKHANIIVNTGQATADNVLALISLIKMKVRDDLGVQLEEEIEYVGF